MLLDIFISLVILPQLLQNNLFFEDFLALDPAFEVAADLNSPYRLYTDVLDVNISAQNALAIDVATGKILYKKNSQEIRPIASITKLMTALVFLDYNPGWEKEFYTIASDRKNGGIIHLNTGEVLSIRNLFNTVLVASDNDAASALARATGLSPEEFVQKMNEKAEELEMNETIFFEPTGLNLNNKSTAEDITRLLNYALQNADIKNATSMYSYQYEVQSKEKTRQVKLVNTNMLTNSYLNVLGGKTGHLEEAGYCLAVKIAGKQNQEVIIVILDSETNFTRFQDVKAIADFVFTNYQW